MARHARRADWERGGWLELARKLDWTFSYVAEVDVFPEVQSGAPWDRARGWLRGLGVA